MYTRNIACDRDECSFILVALKNKKNLIKLAEMKEYLYVTQI